MILLGCMNLNYALIFDCPPDLTNERTVAQKIAYEKWEWSNCVSL